MYSITSLPSHATLPELGEDRHSRMNPAAVYITLARNCVLCTPQRAYAPGAKPYNAAACAVFNAKKIPALQADRHPTTITTEAVAGRDRLGRRHAGRGRGVLLAGRDPLRPRLTVPLLVRRAARRQ